MIGFIAGNFIFNSQTSLITSIRKKEVIYFIEEGIYPTKESLKKNIKDLPSKTIEKENNKYYVYVGITKEKEIAEKMKQIYEKKGYKIKIKEKDNISEEFSINVTQFDLLIQATNDESEILTIEEVVLANYGELTKNNSKK